MNFVEFITLNLLRQNKVDEFLATLRNDVLNFYEKRKHKYEIIQSKLSSQFSFTFVSKNFNVLDNDSTSLRFRKLIL